MSANEHGRVGATFELRPGLAGGRLEGQSEQQRHQKGEKEEAEAEADCFARCSSAATCARSKFGPTSAPPPASPHLVGRRLPARQA